MGDALKILKIFDRNEDGVIDIQEFFSQFGKEYKEEGQNSMIKRTLRKLDRLFQESGIDFVVGMQQLLFTYDSSSSEPVICLDELL
jgi:hypothetical protein